MNVDANEYRTPRQPAGEPRENASPDAAFGHVRWGLATRIFLSFFGVTLIAILVALVGANGLLEASGALSTSKDSFDRVSALLGSNAEPAGPETAGRQRNLAQALNEATGVIGSAVATMEQTRSRVDSLNTVDLPAVIAIGTIRESVTAVAVGERTLLMRQLYNLDIRRQQRDIIKDAFLRADEARAVFDRFGSGLGEEKRQAWKDFSDAWTAWVAVHERLMQRFDDIDKLLNESIRGGFDFEQISKAAYDIAFNDGQKARDLVTQRLDRMVELISGQARESAAIASGETKKATDAANNANQSINAAAAAMDSVRAGVDAANNTAAAAIDTSGRALFWLGLCTALGLAASVGLAVWQTRHVSNPIRHAAMHMNYIAQGNIDNDVMGDYLHRTDEIGALARSVRDVLMAQREEVHIAGEMAAGDFSGHVNLRSGSDQLGKALSEMMRITHDALSRVNRHVQQVTEGAEAISNASQALSVGSIQSASALVQISASVTEIGAQTRKNAENASRANELAVGSRQVAERGYTAVEEMVASMNEIQTSSAQIARIVKLIDDIAFQTNLLALNAAVEAARAGRHGKGFSVVAEEVRNLAGRSAKAARETATLVEDTVQRVANGAAIALRTDEAFKEILANAQQTTTLYGEIAGASREQSKGIDQIASGIGQIDHTTQQNSRYAAETANAAQTLSRQAGELRQMMVRFQLQTDAGAPAASSWPAEGVSGGPRRETLRLLGPDGRAKDGGVAPAPDPFVDDDDEPHPSSPV